MVNSVGVKMRFKYKPHEVAYSKMVLKVIEEGRKLLKSEDNENFKK